MHSAKAENSINIIMMPIQDIRKLKANSYVHIMHWGGGRGGDTALSIFYYSQIRFHIYTNTDLLL